MVAVYNASLVIVLFVGIGNRVGIEESVNDLLLVTVAIAILTLPPLPSRTVSG
jgi:hypothetical protein